MQSWQSAPVIGGQTPAPAPSAQPTVVGGRRVIGDVPPSERRAERDQQLQEVTTAQGLVIERERLRLAQEAAARAAEADRRSQMSFEGTGGAGSESQNKASTLLGRIKGGFADIQDITNTFPEAQRPGLVETLTYGSLGPESVFARGMNDWQRRAINDVQRDIVDALLTLGTGAAYNQEQLEAMRVSYFPQFGDEAQEIEFKNRRLQRMIETARLQAGPNAERLDEALAPLMTALVSKEPEGDGTDQNAPGIDLGGDAQKGYGDDGKGNPLVMGNGEVLLGYEGDAPQYGPFDKNATVDPRAAKLYAKIQSDQKQLGEGNVFDVAKSGIGMGLLDEASGVGNAIAGALQGDFNVGENFQRGAAAEQFRIDQGRESLGGAAIPVELLGAGGAIKTIGAFGQARQAVQSVRNAGAPVTRANVQNAMVRRATGEGVGVGVIAGGAQGNTLEERGTNALLGGVTGGLTGRYGQKAGNALSNRALNPAPQTGGRGVLAAADNLGIEVTPAVTGGTTTRMLTSGARQGFVSARPIEKSVDRMEAQGMAAREQIADDAGQILDPEDAGNIIRKAGEVFSARTSKTGGKLYDRVDRLGGGQKFVLTDGVAEADKWLADVGRSVQGKDGTIYKQIKALRDKMANGEFDVMSIPRTRDEFRALLQETGLRGSTLETAVKQILNKAEGDILNGLRQSGNDRAVGAFKTATDYWRKRVETIDEFFSPILGKNAPKSGEQVVTALERLANPKTGNASQLVGIFKAMPPREAASVRATLINRMGRASAGSANNTDNATFSFETFLTNWNNMSARAKAAAFPSETRKALNDLVTVSAAVKQSSASANRSNTAGALTVQGVISLGWFVDPLTTVAATGGQYVVGRLLASPKFARLLVGASRNTSPSARKSFDAQLTKLAGAEPTLAREIGLYQRALAANDNPASRLAAEDQQAQEPQ